MPDSDPVPAPATSHARWIALGGLILLCGVLVGLFSQLWEAPLFADDSFSVNQVTEMDHWTDTLRPDAFSYFRPVKNLFFYTMVNLDADVLGYHLATLAAYLGATLGVFFLSRRLTESPLWALAATTIWALSATNVTVASWSSCLNISTAVCGICFGLWAWDKWRDSSDRRFLGLASFLLFALALCSYESAVSLAPLAVMLDLYRGRPIFSKASMIRYSGLAVLVGSYLLLRSTQGAKLAGFENPSFPMDIESWQISASAPFFLWTHFLMWLAPWGRLECLGSYIWDQSIPAIILPFCWILLIGIASLCVRFWRAGNLFVFGLAWFFIASFPSSNFVPLGNTPYADYYVTIPSIGLALAIIALARKLIHLTRPESSSDATSKRVAWALLIVLIAGRVANMTAYQGWIEAWKNPAMILAHTAAARPHQYLAKTTLAAALYDVGDTKLAEDYALSSINDLDELAQPFVTLGLIRYQEGRYDEAKSLLLTATQKRFLTSETRHLCNLHLGRIIGRDPEQADVAFQYFVKVLKYHNASVHLEAVLDTAAMYDRASRQRDRISTLERGLEIHPEQPTLQRALKDAQTKLASEKPSP